MTSASAESLVAPEMKQVGLPLRPPIVGPLRELWAHRELLFAWVMREVRLRYKQSVLGGAWAVLQPLSLMAIFSFIFTRLISVPTDGIPYPVFSYAALLPWTLFASSISFGSNSLINNMNLVTKIYFPREVLPFGAVGGALLDFALGAVVFAGLLLVYRVPFHATLLWVPLLVIVEVVLAGGVVLLAAAIMVFYRDVRFVVPLALQLLMYATPIIYPISLIPAGLRTLYLLNPMTGLVESFRRVVLRGLPPDTLELGLAALVSVALFLFSYWFFKRVEWQFADIV